MDTLIVVAGKYLIYLSALAVLAYFLVVRRKTEFAAVVVVSLGLTYVLSRAAGLLYSHVQPCAATGCTIIAHAIDNAFPSDHAGLAAALAAAVFYYNRTLGLLLGVIALLVAWGRVAAGLHTFTDVIVGLLIGIISASLVCAAVHRWFSATLHTVARSNE